MAVYFGFTRAAAWSSGLAPRNRGDTGNPRACGSPTRTSRRRAEHLGDPAAPGARSGEQEIKRECAVISAGCEDLPTVFMVLFPGQYAFIFPLLNG